MSCLGQPMTSIILILLLFIIGLFFWSIYKAITTQQPKYAWGMVPFFLFMGLMFIR